MNSNGDDERLEGRGAFGEGQGPKGWYDNDGRLRGSEKPLPGKCGAHLGGTDPPRYCTRSPLKGRPSCALHGGKSLAGLAHPRARGLAWSKYIPRGLARNYERVIRDPDLLSMRKEAAVLEALEAEQLRRMGEAGQPPWAKAVEALNDIKTTKDDAARQAAPVGRTWRGLERMA